MQIPLLMQATKSGNKAGQPPPRPAPKAHASGREITGQGAKCFGHTEGTNTKNPLTTNEGMERDGLLAQQLEPLGSS